ncbi:hypothetical protein FRC07_011897 [Ceratobasidium sp. 392]|nr:hypothetical protein FRC07_011897 [Ceratobasidium sp. 392]
MLFSSVFSILALVATGANAHGFVDSITCNGKTWKGNLPWNRNAIKSPIRSISTTSPYKDPKGVFQTCGQNAKPGAAVAPIDAGSDLIIDWKGTDKSEWPHEFGALITYMAKVPAGQSATAVDPKNFEFFKIKQTGQEAGQKSGWFLQRIKNGEKYKVTIPKELENGEYIVRHEIIATHLANNKGGAEFYTSCFQVNVQKGTGSAKTKPSPTVRHPGAYSASDPGLFAPRIFDPGFKYQFPGGPLATFSNSGSPGTGVANTNVTVPATTSSTKTSTVKPTTKPTGKPYCKRHWSSRHAIIAAPAS